MDLLPAGPLCLSGNISPYRIWSRRGESLASALCQKDEAGECTGDESLPYVVYWSAVGYYTSVLLKCAVCSSTFLICMEMMISESDGVFLLYNQLLPCQNERNEADNKGSEVLVSGNWAGASFILYQIGFGLQEITFFPSGWCGKVNSLQAERREFLGCLLKFHMNGHTLHHNHSPLNCTLWHLHTSFVI